VAARSAATFDPHRTKIEVEIVVDYDQVRHPPGPGEPGEGTATAVHIELGFG